MCTEISQSDSPRRRTNQSPSSNASKDMKLTLLWLLGTLSLALADEPQIWALLVAGSNYWYNYRHQADVCHAYQILHTHGVPDERIVVMMYDDIAQNKQNPTPGIIINHPNGKDVYHDVPKDYTGKDVTPENFLNILQGNEEAMRNIGSGKVIKSGPNDHVFVNFADHGAVGLVAFPVGELTVNQLNKALKNMSDENKYGKLVFYMEACESGSMFRDRLPDNINIFATTAANNHESSYAVYFDKKRETYLGDVYSVKWMEDSDKENLRTETLATQFKITKKETNTSHVQEFGDLSIARMPVGEFQGEKKTLPLFYARTSDGHMTCPCHEVPLDILMRTRSYTEDLDERQRLSEQIEEMIQKRSYVDEVYRSLVYRLSNSYEERHRRLETKPLKLSQFDCHDHVIKAFSTNCFNFGKNPYALKNAFVLANLCEEQLSKELVESSLETICSEIQEIEGGVH